jgi:ABC-2 type transport system ATP-binding protein
MDCVNARGLTKTYRTRVKKPGLGAALRAFTRPEYREVQAVKGIDLHIESGERVAFIGPNGAGKSTTIKMMTGILSPTSGEISVLGLNPMTQRKQLSTKIGTVFGQKSQLWFHLPAADSFELLGAIYDIDRDVLKKRTAELRERFDLTDFFNTPVRRLSLGQRIRCEVAASLLHEPEALFLDEPTIGLDVVVKRQLREQILEMNREKGVTVFLTSHDAGDIENICQRAIVIDGGEIVLDESVEELRTRHISKKRLTVSYGGSFSPELPEWALDADCTPDHISVTVDTRTFPVDAALNYLVGKGTVKDISVEDPTMEQIIASLFTREDI